MDCQTVVLSYFTVRPDLVRLELLALGQHGSGPFKLVVHHATGTLVESFDDITEALLRQGEFEELLISARSAAPSVQPLMSGE